MPSLKKIMICPSPHLDALVGGEEDAPLVLMLHGFAKSMHCWHAQAAALADRGYRAIAQSRRDWPELRRPENVVVQHQEPDDMPKVSAEDRRKQNHREPRLDSRSSQAQSEPIMPPLIVDGLELVRDSRC